MNVGDATQEELGHWATLPIFVVKRDPCAVCGEVIEFWWHDEGHFKQYHPPTCMKHADGVEWVALVTAGCKEAGDRWLALEPTRQAVREALPQPIWEEVLEELQ